MSRVEELFSAMTRVSGDFGHELREWSGHAHYHAHVRRVQLPFTLSARPPPANPELLKVPYIMTC